MRLSLINEGSKALKTALGTERLSQLKNSMSFMPTKKVKHSLRVGATAAKAGLPADDIEAAILHDYIERGGCRDMLQQLELSTRGMRIIHMLSIDEKLSGSDDTQTVNDHIQQMLNDKQLPEHDKNIAIVIKCADRIDNLKKRLKRNNLTKKYRNASAELFQLLLKNYTGDPDIIRSIKTKIGKFSIFNV